MASKKPVRLTVATANIGRGVSSAYARHNIARVMRRWPAASIGWQEIDEADRPDEHQLLHAYLVKVARPLTDALHPGTPPAPLDSLRTVGWWTATPLFVPPGWRVVERYVDQTCEGRDGLTPHRVCVQALLEHEQTGLRLVRKNGHYPRDEIADLWEQCDDAWRRITQSWRERGFTQIDTRDVNKARRQPLHKTERLLLGAGLDKITYIPGSPERGVRLERAAPGRRVNLTIDGHDALGQALIVKPPREAAHAR